MWDIACNTSSPRFGSTKVKFDEENGKLVTEESIDSEYYVGQLPFTVYAHEAGSLQASNFCDVLGPQQRLWLQEGLRESTAPLKVIVSGSVIFGNPTYTGKEGPCSSDDIEARNLIFTPSILNRVAV